MLPILESKLNPFAWCIYWLDDVCFSHYKKREQLQPSQTSQIMANPSQIKRFVTDIWRNKSVVVKVYNNKPQPRKSLAHLELSTNIASRSISKYSKWERKLPLTTQKHQNQQALNRTCVQQLNHPCILNAMLQLK